MKRTFLIYLFLILGFASNCLAQITEPEIDMCDTDEYWRAEIRSDEYEHYDGDDEDYEDMPPLKVYTPGEFFSPGAAEIPDFDPNAGVYQRISFFDRSCQTDEFEVEFNFTYGRGQRDQINIVLYVQPEQEPDMSFLNGLKSGKGEEKHNVALKITSTPPQHGLRSEIKGSTKFKYKDGIVTKYDNDIYVGYERIKICRISGLFIHFPTSGGAFNEVSFTDHTNGTTWREDFSDCSNSNLFPKCPPPPPEELEVKYKLPDCNNSDLVFKAETNLDEILWAGPNGFTSTGTDLLIPYEEAKSGCYIAYGRRDRCSNYIYKKVCVEIPNLDVTTKTETLDICDIEEYQWGDTILKTSGIYTRHTKDPETKCDNVEILKLTVHKTNVDIYEELCPGDTIVFNGDSLTNSGDYTNTVTTTDGACDSTTTLHLTVHPKIPLTYVDTSFCYGETVQIGPYIYNHTTYFALTFRSATGCDSSVFYRLNRRPLDTLSLEPQTFCEGTEVMAFGKRYRPTQDTMIVKESENEYGCPHYDIQRFYKIPTAESKVDTFICYGEKLTMPNGDEYVGEKTFRYYYPDPLSVCDSVVEYHIKYRKKDIVVNDTVFLCEEGGGDIVEKETVYETNEYGCQRTIETPILHRDITKTTQQLEICYGDTVFIGENRHYKAGVYTDTLTASTGCDSIVTTDLAVKPKREQMMPEERICTTEKTGRDTIEVFTDDGDECPLIITTPILYLSPKTQIIDTMLCEGQTIIVNGTEYDATGEYETHTTASNSCDSTIILKLTISDIIKKEVYDTICFDSEYITHKSTYTASGTYTENYISLTACDTIVTIHLFVREEMRDTLDTIKECKPAGTEALYTDKTDELAKQTDAKTGCDIRIFQPFHYAFEQLTEKDINICEGETYTVEGETYTESGDYTVMYQTTEGCDSTYLFHLKVETMERITNDSALICSKEDIGKQWTDTDTIQHTDGTCPHIEFTPHRNIPIYDIYFDTTLCSGKPVEFEGETFTTAGSHQVVLTATNGCDSVRHIRINYIRPQETLLNIKLCYGETHTSSVKTYDKTGRYIEQLSNVNGCDSVSILNITIAPLIEKTLPAIKICETDSIEYHGVVYSSDTTHIDTLYSADGCPMYHYTKIITDPAIPFEEKEYAMCKGERRYINAYSSDLSGQIYNWYPSTYLDRTDKGATYVSPASDINYTVTITRGKCKTENKVKVRVLERPKIQDVQVDDLTKTATVIATGGKDIRYICEDLDYEGESNQIKFEKPGWYDIKVSDETECTDSLHFFYKSPIYPAIVMHPNKDGKNKHWIVEGLDAYNHYRIWIYDRWGKLLRYYEDNFTGWDGTYNGIPMPSTDYWYVISIDLGDIEIAGHFTLLREK